MIRVAEIPHRYVIKQHLNAEYRQATKARTKKANIKMKRPRTIIFDDVGTSRGSTIATVRRSIDKPRTKRSRSPLQRSDPKKKKMKKAHLSTSKPEARQDPIVSQENDSNDSTTITTDTKTSTTDTKTSTSKTKTSTSKTISTTNDSRLLSMYNAIMKTSLASQLESDLHFIISHEEKRTRQGQLDALRIFREDILDVLHDGGQCHDEKVARTQLNEFVRNMDRRIHDMEKLILESEKASLFLHRDC